jgi:hypothetical protein
MLTHRCGAFLHDSSFETSMRRDREWRGRRKKRGGPSLVDSPRATMVYGGRRWRAGQGGRDGFRWGRDPKRRQKCLSSRNGWRSCQYRRLNPTASCRAEHMNVHLMTLVLNLRGTTIARSFSPALDFFSSQKFSPSRRESQYDRFRRAPAAQIHCHASRSNTDTPRATSRRAHRPRRGEVLGGKS